MRRIVAASVVAGITTSLLAACSTLTSSTSPTTGPTTADAALVGQGVETSLESSIGSFLGGVTPPIQSFNRAGSFAAMPLLRLSHVPLDLARGSRTAGHPITIRGAGGGVPSCVVLTPTNPTDTDGDGIPDTVSMAAGPNCTLTNDSVTISISGSIILGDPTPTTPDANYMSTVNNLILGVNTGADSATIGLNGTATVTETSGSLSQSNQLTLALKSTGTDTVNASFAQNWMATFAFTGGVLTASNSGLPAGTLTVTGTTSFTGNGKSFALAISTPTALTYDPTCGTASQITAGTVQATFSGTNGTTYVTLTWSGCQAPAVTFVSPS